MTRPTDLTASLPPGEERPQPTPRAATLAGASPSRTAPGPAPSRLSFAQQRLWFLDQLEPGGTVYNLPAVLKLTGPLDVAVLERSLGELVRRHQALRTTFRVQGGQPVQVVSAPEPLSLPSQDLSHLPPEGREGEARRRMEEEIERPFDLARGPLFRALLLKLDEREHLLVVTMHHIISDGWSISVMVREVLALYEAFRQGKPSPLPELRMQYPAYAAWQRQRLTGDVLAKQLDYWRAQLAGTAQALELPTDRPRPPVQTYRGAVLPVEVPKATVDALERLCQREGATLFMVLLAAFELLLHRYSGQEDFCVGSPVAGRQRAELEALIGFFVSTLVLRARLEGDPPFIELLERVRETALGAYAHQDVPFEKLVEELRPARDPSRSPLFQVMLILQNTPPRLPADPASGLTLQIVEAERPVSKFELVLAFDPPGPDGLHGRLQYNTDLFDRGTAARLANHLRVLLEGIAARPTARLSELPLLTEAERRQLLGWSGGPAEPLEEVSFPALFEAQVRRTPDAVALCCDDERLTYAQLAARVHRLAHQLRGEGVGPETRVGLCLERSTHLAVAMLAIIEAGGAYVPLDPNYPPERRAFMLADSGARVLVTQRAHAPSTPPAGVRVLTLEDLSERVAKLPDTAPASSVHPEQLAYVIYTSGSTGRPKGVMVPHRALARFLSGMDARVERPASGGVWLAVSSVSFDVSVLELLWTLTRGFQVVLQPDITSAGWLARQVERHRVTHLQCTPSLMQPLLLEPSAPEALRQLHQLFLGAEPLPPELARALLPLLPESGLVNLSGTTETTVWCSTHAVRELAGAIPVGTPIAGATWHVLDEGLRPVPVGVPGELYIGGAAVTRGYLGRPELTAERFLPDPFSSEPGARLYRTGDRARWRADGTVELLGRVDFQVKVRGHRIEPGEIEAQLERHPTVRRAVVVARGDAPGEKRLVGYVVSAPETVAEPNALRAWLRERLPEYMVPTAFVVLEALPLTPSGKVDRKALPAPARPFAARARVAPRTPAEEALARVWTRVLGLEQVGVHDNFFELGGDSLMGLRMIALANQAGLGLHPKQLFQHQTIEALAAVAGGAAATEAVPSDAAAATAADERLPLTLFQRWFVRHLEIEQDLVGLNLVWDVPPAIDLDVLRAAVAFVIQHHEAFRLRLFQDEAGWAQRLVASEGAAPVEVYDLSGSAPEARDQAVRDVVARLHYRQSLTRGPVLQFAICRMGGAGPDKLIAAVHHFTYDAYSVPMIFEDLGAAYQEIARGQAPSPPLVTTRYRQYARALAAQARPEALREARAFWLDEARLRPVEPVPVDFDGPPVTAGLRRLSAPLPPELGQAMLAYVKAHPDVQLHDLLMFGFAGGYARWSGGRALRTDVEHNGRTGMLPGVDLSRVVGPFSVRFPVRFEARLDAPPEEAFAGVRQALREARAHALGYSLLRYGADEEARKKLDAVGTAQLFFNHRPAARPPKDGGLLGIRPPQRVFLPRADGQPGVYPYAVTIECDGAGAGLVMTLKYISTMYREETMQALGGAILAQIAALVGGA